MEEPTTIRIPLLNPNEREVLIAALHVHEGQMVASGDLICTVETTKSAADIEADRDGYVKNLNLKQGDIANAGSILCFLADSQDWKPAVIESETDDAEAASKKVPGIEIEVPKGLRITKPALALAREYNLNLKNLPTSEMITRDRLKRIIDQSEASTLESKDEKMIHELIPKKEYDTNALIVYGGGGHGKALVELIRSLSIYDIVGILDDGIEAGTDIMGIPVFGGGEVLKGVFDRGINLAVNAVGGIGDVKVRADVFKKLLETGFACPSVIHPSAIIEASSKIASGIQIFPQAYIGSEVNIGFGTIINTGAIVSHNCSLDEYVNISPGAVLAGMVRIEKSVLVGMGVTVNLGVNIGEGARIGNGATVKEDIPPKTFVRAGSIWPA